jgi:hypothetical protein
MYEQIRFTNMKIYVRTLTGRTIVLEVPDSENIEQVKQDIRDSEDKSSEEKEEEGDREDTKK